MNAVTSKTSRKRLKPVAGAVQPDETIADLPSIRRRVTELVANRAAEMVEATIASATEGQYAAMRYLFEMIGLFPATIQPEAESGGVVPSTLFRELSEMAAMETEVTDVHAPHRKRKDAIP